MISAFGVDHGGSEEIAKFKVPGMKSMMRMGSPGTMQQAGVKGFNRARKQGANKFSAGLRGVGSAIKSSPGTAAITGGVTGLAGYGGYKALDRD